MSTFKPTLGQALTDRKVRCRTPGCNGQWIWTGREQLECFSKGSTNPPKRMCPDCYSLFKELSDIPVECSRPECKHTWTWSRAAQLRQIRSSGKKGPPARLCDACLAEASEMSDQKVPCRIRGCTNTWSWSAAAQMRAGLPESSARPPSRMCESCHAKLKTSEDLEIPCRIDGCTGTWTYTREQQLVDSLKHKESSRKGPPKRMCDSCFERFKSLSDMDVSCRIPGCSEKWRWPRGAILTAWIEAGTEDPPPPPQRMCRQCSEMYAGLHDEEMTCKIPGCSSTWVDKRGFKLNRIRSGKGAKPPERLCDDCRKMLDELEDKEIPCRNEGCNRTWTWKREAQLRAEKSQKKKPVAPSRMCEECSDFIKTHPPTSLTCCRCNASIPWSTENQLKVFLGLWQEPRFCGGCLSKEKG